MLGTRMRLVSGSFDCEVRVIAERFGRYTVQRDDGSHVYGVSVSELRPIVEAALHKRVAAPRGR